MGAPSSESHSQASFIDCCSPIRATPACMECARDACDSSISRSFSDKIAPKVNKGEEFRFVWLSVCTQFNRKQGATTHRIDRRKRMKKLAFFIALGIASVPATLPAVAFAQAAGSGAAGAGAAGTGAAGQTNGTSGSVGNSSGTSSGSTTTPDTNGRNGTNGTGATNSNGSRRNGRNGSGTNPAGTANGTTDSNGNSTNGTGTTNGTNGNSTNPSGTNGTTTPH